MEKKKDQAYSGKEESAGRDEKIVKAQSDPAKAMDLKKNLQIICTLLLGHHS